MILAWHVGLLINMYERIREAVRVNILKTKSVKMFFASNRQLPIESLSSPISKFRI